MRGGFLSQLWDHDLAWSFRRSPVTVVAALVTLACVAGAALSPWLSPQDPFNAASLDLNAAFKPPAWLEGGDPAFLLGSDNQGRDILSTIMHGARISLAIGFASVLLSLALGVFLGLVAGYFGGRLDAVLMRIADVQLSFPAILIALLIDGVARIALGGDRHEEIAIPVLILSIGLSKWVDYARTVRGSTMVERGKEYVQAARVVGRGPIAILFKHVLPNVMGPVLVIATINIGVAIIIEATLSFLGVGVPATQPSLGTLIRVGNEFLYSGEWWITVFPGAALIVLVLSVNLLGDWLRDALNPKLR